MSPSFLSCGDASLRRFAYPPLGDTKAQCKDRLYPRISERLLPSFTANVSLSEFTRMLAIVVGLFFLSLQVAYGQKLKADFQFHNGFGGTLVSAVSPPATLANADYGNIYQTETVDGATRTVVRFPYNSGLVLEGVTDLLPRDTYTIVLLFKFDEVSGYRRVVDFINFASDSGLYIEDGHLEFCTTCSDIPPNTYVQVVYTRDANGTMAGYVNGVKQGERIDSGGLATTRSNLVFFRDDLQFPGEASAGSVARIRLYDAPMTPAQVAALDRLPLGLGCTYTPLQTSFDVAAVGGTFTLGLTPNNIISGCPWAVAASSAPWIKVQPPSSPGDSVTYLVAANTSNSVRTGTIILVGGQTVTVTQQAAATPPPNTPVGENTSVSVGDVTLNFANVTSAGTTTVTPIDPNMAGQLPANYALAGGNLVYEIATTARFSGNIDIAFRVPQVNDAAAFARLRLLHREDGVLVDRTLRRDFAVKTIWARVTSLSPFVIAEMTQPQTNPIDTVEVFVEQHYRDFLSRQSDAPGFAFWTKLLSERLAQCAGQRDVMWCRERARASVSEAFFVSIEFQQTGYLVYRLYKTAFAETATRPRAFPRYDEFMRDAQQIGRGVVVNASGWEQQLETNKQAFIREFIGRPEFLARYPKGMTAAAYVESLYATAQLTPTADERLAAVTAFGTGDAEGRAKALRSVAETREMFFREFNQAFVLMQYIGYLRRSPDDPRDLFPNTFNGLDFWLAKLNSASGDYRRYNTVEAILAPTHEAQMVEAFITSGEYRDRFGTGSTPPPPTPNFPTGLTATAVSATQINLTWADNSANETGFQIERSLNGTTFTQIATVAANVTTYQNTGLTPSTTYYYRVRAYNSAGNSAYSDVVSASMPVLTNAWGATSVTTQVLAVAIAPNDPNTIWSAGTGRIYRSTDKGANWGIRVSGTITWYSLILDGSGAAFAGFYGGVIRFGGSGGSGQVLISGGYVKALVIDPKNPNVIYAGGSWSSNYQDNNIFKSTDGGATWRVTGNCDTGFCNIGSNVIAINPSNTNVIYAGTGVNTIDTRTGANRYINALRSTNGGVSYPDGVYFNLGQVETKAIAIDPSNPNIMYAGTYGGGIYKTTNGGVSGSAANNGLTSLTVLALAIDPANTNTIYAGTYGGGVFKSTNGGASWAPFNTGLTNRSVNALAVDPTGKYVYAGTDAGVFIYNYGG